MKTPEEIKKGLECCAGMHNHSYCKECPYADCDCDEMSSDALAYLNELEEREWQLFDLLSSTWFTKACYFKQEDGTVYSRVSGEYMTFEQAIDEFAHELTDEAQVQKWISIKRRTPKRGHKVLVINGHGYISIYAFWSLKSNKWTWVDESGHFNHVNDITHWMPLPERPKEG